MIDFEHAVFMLLLLVGVFSARPPRRELTPVFILAGLLLTFVPPYVRVPIPWSALLYLVVPLLFWQNARHWLKARWAVSWTELSLWLLTALSLSLILWLAGNLSWPGIILFGVVAASMLWRANEPGKDSRRISQLGPLTLVFLLTEVDLAVETPNLYLGGLLSGAAIGFAVAFLAIRLAQKLVLENRGWVALGQVYLAFWVAVLIGGSGVAAALFSIAVYTEFSLRHSVGQEGLELSAPLDHWIVFLALLALFVFVGWQAHRPFSTVLLFEAGMGSLIGLLIAWSGRLLGVPGFHLLASIWQVGVQVGLFLFAALLLWPRGTLIEPLSLAVALGLALLITVLSVTFMAATESLQENPR